MKKSVLSCFKIYGLLIYLSLSACQPEEGLSPSSTGTVVFSTSMIENSENGRNEKILENALSHVIISLESTSSSDSAIITKELSLYNFNGSWISEPIALETIEYEITQFLISTPNGDIAYAAPTAESKFAYLVDNPLPQSFSVQADETTKVSVEVISTEDSTPEDFGYSTFAFDVVETFDFLLSVFTYNQAEENFELTSSSLTILANKDTLAQYSLDAITNSVKVLGGYDHYDLYISKENYLTYHETYSATTLKSYNSQNNGPLIIKLESSVDITKGLQAHYPFEGNAEDHSPMGYDGTVSGATLTHDKLNNTQNAYLFDGEDDLIDVGQVDLDISDQVSVSAWVKTSSTKENHWISGKYNWTEDKGFSLRIVDGNVHFSGRDGNNEFITANGTSTVNDGEWHHVVGIADGSTWQVWVDGVLETEVDSGHSISNINSSDPLGIGYYYYGITEDEDRYFDGTIDNVRIYNRPLTAPEIQQLYQNYE